MEDSATTGWEGAIPKATSWILLPNQIHKAQYLQVRILTSKAHFNFRTHTCNKLNCPMNKQMHKDPGRGDLNNDFLSSGKDYIESN